MLGLEWPGLPACCALSSRSCVIKLGEPVGGAKKRHLKRGWRISASINSKSVCFLKKGEIVIGSIIGDIVGSRFEGINNVTEKFDLFSRECEFTDDTVCVVALADSLLSLRPFQEVMREWILRYPSKEYGDKFKFWALQESSPSYGSYGNGGCARLSPMALFYEDACLGISKTLENIALSHSHPDAIHAANVLIDTIYSARNGFGVGHIREHLLSRYNQKVCLSVQFLRSKSTFSTDAADSIEPALAAALNSQTFEGSIRNAVLIGGDTDTIACMAGGVAEALYGIPENIVDHAIEFLPIEMIDVMQRLYRAAGFSRIGIPVHQSIESSNEGFPNSVLHKLFGAK
jgi:ADP-ribosyl-[dinitrogen reductase] hydrolase